MGGPLDVGRGRAPVRHASSCDSDVDEIPTSTVALSESDPKRCPDDDCHQSNRRKAAVVPWQQSDVVVFPKHDIATSSDFVDHLLTQGWAVVRVGEETSVALNECSSAALSFFDRDARDKAETRRIVDGHLVGYNKVSPAKELLRTFPGACDNQWSPGNQWSWPSDATALQLAAKRVFAGLRDVLDAATARCFEVCSGETFNEYAARHAPPNRGTKEEGSEALWATSPLDIFLYHNDESAAATHNCEAHVDRGLMSCIAVSDVCGVAVVDRQSSGWRLVENNLEPYDHVVVIVNKTLESLTEMDGKRDRMLQSCVHQVIKAHVPRLSISLELRAPYS